MNKFKEQMNKPITWGGWLKLNVIAGILSWIYAIIVWWKLGVFEFLGIDRKLKKRVDDTKEKLGKTYFGE